MRQIEGGLAECSHMQGMWRADRGYGLIATLYTCSLHRHVSTQLHSPPKHPNAHLLHHAPSSSCIKPPYLSYPASQTQLADCNLGFLVISCPLS